MRPVTPYGIAKAFATQMVTLYRESFGLFACNAICYNHESPRRGESFVTRKITRAAAAISLGLEDPPSLGALDGRRDWGYAPEYVDAMWRMLQHEVADDYVLATGQLHTLKDLLEIAFRHVGLDWKRYVTTDKQYSRTGDTTSACGNSAKARRVLRWQPVFDFRDMICKMVDADLAMVTQA